jgi:metal regulatory transcription factor 1
MLEEVCPGDEAQAGCAMAVRHDRDTNVRVSFCRKTTMVKHQRRSHQRGFNPNEMLEDCTSDSDSGESPSTPKHSGMAWPVQGVMAPGHPAIPHGHTMHRAASFADFGHHMNNYNLPQQYGHRHSMSSGQAHEFHGQPVPEQHHVPMLHRTASLPQGSYYVTEQSNPGVATMNTNPMPPHYQIPRQPVERLPLEIPYSGPGMAASIQSSPSSFSAASGRSPSTQEGFYTHQPTQAATYALHNASPVEQQAPPPPQQQATQQMVSYPSPLPHEMSMSQQPQQPMPQQHQPQQPMNSPQQAMPQQVTPQPSPAPPSTEQFQQSAAQPEPTQWYSSVQYQPPVEVQTIGSLPTYGSSVYDPWPKLEFTADPSMQMPSERIANM